MIDQPSRLSAIPNIRNISSRVEMFDFLESNRSKVISNNRFVYSKNV